MIIQINVEFLFSHMSHLLSWAHYIKRSHFQSKVQNTCSFMLYWMGYINVNNSLIPSLHNNRMLRKICMIVHSIPQHLVHSIKGIIEEILKKWAFFIFYCGTFPMLLWGNCFRNVSLLNCRQMKYCRLQINYQLQFVISIHRVLLCIYRYIILCPVDTFLYNFVTHQSFCIP